MALRLKPCSAFTQRFGWLITLTRRVQSRLLGQLNSAFQGPFARGAHTSSRRMPLADAFSRPVDEKSDWAVEFVAESVEHGKLSI